MKALVVDASAALKLVRLEDGRDDVRRSIHERRLADAPINVPGVFWLEVVNTLARRHRYAAAEVLEAVYELEQVGLATAEIGRPGTLAVIDLVERLRLSAYDAAYLALAEAGNADLLTADRRLAAAAGDRAIYVGPREVAEVAMGYRADPTWPTWPGAVAYLQELRRRTLATR